MESKIVIALRRRYHCEKARAVLEQNNLPYSVCEIDLQDSRYSIIRSLIQKGARVLITGDVYASDLLDQLDISIVTIRRSRVSFSDSIRQALQIAPRAVIIWRENDRVAARQACRNFGDLVTFCPISDSNRNFDAIFRHLKAQGLRVVIGAGTLNPYAERYGMSVVNVPYDDDDILSAVRLAEHNLRALEEREEFTGILKSIQDHIAEGIVALTPDGHIQTVNRVAAQILRMDPKILERMSLSQTPLACQEAQELLNRLKPFDNKIITVKGCPLTMDGRPVFVGHELKSAILTLTPVERLQRVEQSVRAKLTPSGDKASVTFSDIVGASPALCAAIRTAKQYAQVDSSVLVYGQSGTGKEMFVQSIHNSSARRNAPFVVINCAALPETLIESELFGYEKGAFTGALSNGKQGLFERGHRGTVFLDEISEMPLHVQARFLRVLQERVVQPVGGQRTIPVDIRVTAATSRDLREMVEKQQFREDLFYRISVLTMSLPPLSQREGDVELLVNHFVARKREQLHLPVWDVSREALAFFNSLSYSGNIRQLSNIVERAMVLCSGGVLDLDAVAKAISCGESGIVNADKDIHTINTAIASLQGDAIRRTLEKHNGNRAKAAQELGISISTLYRRIRKFGM